MNRNLIKVILVLFSLLISCKTEEKKVDVIGELTDYPVIIKLSKKYKKVRGISFPYGINIKNNSIEQKDFIKIEYEYNSIIRDRSSGISLYTEEDNVLVQISNNKKKEIPVFNSKNYILYTRHFIDSISLIQDQLKPYVIKMLKEGKDTLHISGVKQFKKKHKKLFQKLTERDSLSIKFNDNERVTKAIKW